jgi:arabinogalactan oligomer/maltooligosaccharide transport system permease protein
MSEWSMDVRRRVIQLLTILLPGAGQFINRQYMKSILLLSLTGIAIWKVVLRLPHAIWGIVTMGTQKQHLTTDSSGFPVMVKGDHSILLLLNGLFVLFFLIIYVGYIYVAYRDYRYNAKLIASGKPVATFRQSLRNLFETRFAEVMLTVPSLGVLFITIIPIVFTVMIAFTDYRAPDHLPPAKLLHWVGFQNFIDLLTFTQYRDTFFGILRWTFIWATLATATTFFGGFLVALLVSQKTIRFKKIWRTILILPFAVPQLVSLLVMRNLFNGEFGPINDYLVKFGFNPVPWLSDPFWAKVTVIIVNMWVGVPVSMIFIMGILTMIPGDLYEAAKIDGASNYRQFTTITLPYVLFATAPIIIMQFAGNINNFNVIFLLTNGNPANGNYQYAGDTDLLVTWLYKLTLDTQKYNMAGAIGIIIFLIIASLSLISYRQTSSFKEEDQVQ